MRNNIVPGLNELNLQGEVTSLWLEVLASTPSAARLLLALGFAWNKLWDQLYQKAPCSQESPLMYGFIAYMDKRRKLLYSSD